MERGESVGRYVVVDEVASGAMGVVYKAYDPKLERAVALKLLKVGATGDESRARLVREAQALARLKHPNVVAVHDVGEHEDNVFLALDYLEGETLASWLEAEEREPREIVSVFVAAGRGLEGAHEAGLIHRDFKPDNVIVGEDGAIHLLDFGLARAAFESDEQRADDDDPSELESPLTRDGQRLGTPVYMAPEQHAQEAVSEATDQFSFCAALYEALYKQRAFPGERYQEYAKNVCDGNLREPPATVVPKPVAKAIVRGLESDPSDRHPSMTALLGELSADPGRRRRAIGVGLAGVTVLGVAAFALMNRDVPKKCMNPERSLAGVWDDARKSALQAALKETGKSYADETHRRVVGALDQYTSTWVDVRREACQATHIHGEQTESLLDLRMRCLARRLSELDALVSLLSDKPDSKTLDRAVDAAYALTPVSSCSDLDALTSVIEPPKDEALQTAVEAVDAKLDSARALKNVGKFGPGLEIAAAAVKEAEALEYRPLEARARYLLGDLQLQSGARDDAEKTLYLALQDAAHSRDDRLAAEALARNVYVVGYQHERFDEALALAKVADALLARSGGDEAIGGALDVKVALVLKMRGKLEEAEARLQRALKSFRASLPPEHPYITNALSDLAGVYFEQKNVARAGEVMADVLANQRKTLGDHHPFVGSSLANLAVVNLENKNNEAARRYFGEAMDVFIASKGATHPDVGQVHAALGDLAATEARHSDAAASFRKALEILGRDGPRSAYPLIGLAKSLHALEEFDEAVEALEQAVAVRSQAGVDPRRLARAQFVLAQVLWDQGSDRTRAISIARESAKGYEAAGERGASGAKDVTEWLAERSRSR